MKNLGKLRLGNARFAAGMSPFEAATGTNQKLRKSAVRSVNEVLIAMYDICSCIAVEEDQAGEDFYRKVHAMFLDRRRANAANSDIELEIMRWPTGNCLTSSN